MVAFDTVKAGDVLYDCHREKMGHTTISRMGCWSVRVISIDQEKRSAVVSWNGNRPQTYYLRQIERLRRSPPKRAGTHGQ